MAPNFEIDKEFLNKGYTNEIVALNDLKRIVPSFRSLFFYINRDFMDQNNKVLTSYFSKIRINLKKHFRTNIAQNNAHNFALYILFP